MKGLLSLLILGAYASGCKTAADQSTLATGAGGAMVSAEDFKACNVFENQAAKKRLTAEELKDQLRTDKFLLKTATEGLSGGNLALGARAARVGALRLEGTLPEDGLKACNCTQSPEAEAAYVAKNGDIAAAAQQLGRSAKAAIEANPAQADALLVEVADVTVQLAVLNQDAGVAAMGALETLPGVDGNLDELVSAGLISQQAAAGENPEYVAKLNNLSKSLTQDPVLGAAFGQNNGAKADAAAQQLTSLSDVSTPEKVTARQQKLFGEVGKNFVTAMGGNPAVAARFMAEVPKIQAVAAPARIGESKVKAIP